MENRHATVLLHEAVEALAVQSGDIVVDGTLGAAGHFRELAAVLGTKGTLVGIDADKAAIERATVAAAELEGKGPTVHLVNDNFRNLGRILDDLGLDCIDRALFDLGWNTNQLEEGRGFSFRADEPLH